MLYIHPDGRGTERDDECAGATGRNIRGGDQASKSLSGGIKNGDEIVT